ncbi:MAG TPA: YigZ family protein [Treponemataceae bacterium]|nr:YigZ family protein [Treponemataceae bacterium]
MNVLLETAKAEITIKNSRFIAEVFSAANQKSAREILKKQKALYFDARHVVHAFVIGNNKEILGMSDDGEPPGTAGRPVLDVLKGSGITNVVLTVSRYFGGTLLGTGGLVKAYGAAAKAVLSIASTEPLVEKKQFSFSVSYSLYENTKLLLNRLNATDLCEKFETSIHINGNIPLANAKELLENVFDLTKGSQTVIFDE